MSLRRTPWNLRPLRDLPSWRLGAGIASVLGLGACADPCLDDGLLQDQQNGDCPIVASGTGDATDSATDTAATDGVGDCGNGMRDGDETDVDCGGSCAASCGDGQGCGSDEDCASGRCDADENECVPNPTCADGEKNGDETDVDCGGGCPNNCDDGEGCEDGDDCVSGQCDPDTMTCDPSGDCSDGMQNGDETDVDCGGSCKLDCDDGDGCEDGDDCISTICDPKTMTCTPAGDCTDGVQNGDESDIDCGGTVCDACPDGDGCDDDADCASGVCDEPNMVCLPPACDDGVVNGDETDVDCGGSCPADCDDGEDCLADDDCTSQICDPGSNTCASRSCNDGVQNGDETDVDCGGTCPTDCDDGEDCLVGEDCVSQVCDPVLLTCTPPSCDDGIQNGSETDLDCGGSCGNTCETGEDCLSGLDCVDDVCDPDTTTCAPPLSVVAAPSCSDFAGLPVGLSAVASGGTGVYTYSWTPADSLDDATSATPNAAPAGFVSYTVTVDDGVNQAVDTVTVVDNQPFDLQNNCGLQARDFLNSAGPPSVTYSQGGTVACENGNNDFGLHLCEDVVFEDVQLRGVLEVTNDANDDDLIGLVWGAQDNAHFYSLTWKRLAQDFFGCNVPQGIVVKRVEAASFNAMTGADVYCAADTAGSTLLLSPAETTTAGWAEGQSYTVTIDYATTGSSVTVVRDSDGFQIAQFDVNDATFPSGAFGSTVISQANSCVGPLTASCL